MKQRAQLNPMLGTNNVNGKHVNRRVKKTIYREKNVEKMSKKNWWHVRCRLFIPFNWVRDDLFSYGFSAWTFTILSAPIQIWSPPSPSPPPYARYVLYSAIHVALPPLLHLSFCIDQCVVVCCALLRFASRNMVYARFIYVHEFLNVQFKSHNDVLYKTIQIHTIYTMQIAHESNTMQFLSCTRCCWQMRG